MAGGVAQEGGEPAVRQAPHMVEVPADHLPRQVAHVEGDALAARQIGREHLLLHDAGQLHLLEGLRLVAEDLHSADDVALVIQHGGGAGGERHAGAGLGQGVDEHGVLGAHAAHHGAVQGAQVRGAEVVAVLVHVAQHVGGAAPAAHFVGAVARDALGGAVPEHDAALGVGDVDAGVDEVEYLAEPALVDLVRWTSRTASLRIARPSPSVTRAAAGPRNARRRLRRRPTWPKIAPMRTEILRADNAEHLARAAAHLRAGRLVAFPTETVYGLGARADDEAAAG